MREPMTCFGCGMKGHGIQACGKIEDLIKSGIIMRDPYGKLIFTNGTFIYRRMGESFTQAIERIRADNPDSFKSHFISIQEQTSDYYQSEAEDDYDAFVNSGFASQDNTQVFAAERTPQKIAAARKQALDGVYPPSRNKGKEKEKENVPPVPSGQVRFGPRHIQETTQGKAPYSIHKGMNQPPVKTVQHTPLQQIPFDARTRRRVDEDTEMKDATQLVKSKTGPMAERNIPVNKTKPFARQSEISAALGETQVVSQILNTPVTLSVQEVLASSKELSEQLSEMIERKNVKMPVVATLGEDIVATLEEDIVATLERDRSKLIRLQVE